MAVQGRFKIEQENTCMEVEKIRKREREFVKKGREVAMQTGNGCYRRA